MSSINDWAAKAAKLVRNEYLTAVPDMYMRYTLPTEQRIAAIIATFTEPLVALLREARREHSDGEDIDCPMANPQYSYNLGCACECGADAWNKKIDAVLGGKS